MKLLINTDLVKIYVKGDNFEVGRELPIAHELLTEAFIGYKTFGRHLKHKKDRDDFYEGVQSRVFAILDIFRKGILKP